MKKYYLKLFNFLNNMKIIIGINANHADASACIIKLMELIVAAIEEERINRLKHFSGYPIKSIKECLNVAKLKSEEITDIAFNTKPSSNLTQKIIFFEKFILKSKSIHEKIFKKINIKNELFKHFKINIKMLNCILLNIIVWDIASAFYPSGF